MSGDTGGREEGSPAEEPQPSPISLTTSGTGARGDRLLMGVFVGRQGLRAGWAVLLFAALWWVFNFAAQFVTAPLLHQDWDAPLRAPTVLLIEVWQLFGVVAATGLMAFFERRRLWSYGFQGRGRGVRFVSGLAWGFVAISALVLAMRGSGFLTFSSGDGWAWKDAAAWGGVFLLTGLAEEAMFRGYAQFTLARGMGFWPGALLCAACFGLMHRANGGESMAGTLAAGAIGLVFCLSLWYTGTLWWAVGFHAAWDWGESYVYGTADSGMVTQGHWLRAHATGPLAWSGGSVGPEGSLLIWPLMGLIALGMVVWWGKRGEKTFRKRTQLHPQER